MFKQSGLVSDSHISTMDGSLPVLLLTFLAVAELWGQCLGSEFYADNGLQQTVLIDKRNPHKREEVRQEILTLLGLHHRPRPNREGHEHSARQFMIDLYRTLQTEDGEDLADETEFQFRINLTLGKTVIHINGTDVIRSFINHGTYLQCVNSNNFRSVKHTVAHLYYYKLLHKTRSVHVLNKVLIRPLGVTAVKCMLFLS